MIHPREMATGNVASASRPILDLAREWLAHDYDELTRKEIQHLVKVGDEVELERRLRKPIAFGTAGLRSSMKVGFAHMNSLTVLRASQGLADYVLQEQKPSDGHRMSVVVGYDGRHQSEKFARLAAGAFTARGLRVLWFDKLVHTPMIPFAVSHFRAAAGVMVTASHNPKTDNGYKVYWQNGCQIIPPHDKGIAKAIEKVELIVSWNERTVDGDALVQRIFSEAQQAYLASIQRLVPPPKTGDSALYFTYTPMHGVGLPFMREVAEMLGFEGGRMHSVKLQAQPDPEFPTVSFPNPEEKGALELAYKEAEANGSTIVIANDPDADRFAAAERLRDGTWHQFTGNQMGILLASYILEISLLTRDSIVMLASTVSSRMLAVMAKMEGIAFHETLTGFKWLGNVAQQAQAQGKVPLFAYEEAIGYMFPEVVSDKDGIAAAAVFLTAWRTWQQEYGLTPWQKLQELYRTYGFFEDANTYMISPSPEVTENVFTAIRTSDNGERPSRIGKRQILRWRDLTLGYDSSTHDAIPVLPTDMSSQMITCELEDAVFTARGSGTEPKIKLYIEALGARSSAQGKEVANEVLYDLVKNWFPKLRLAGT